MGFYEDIVNILSTPDEKNMVILCTMPAVAFWKTIHERSIEITVGAKIQVLQRISRILLVNARDRYEALKR
jgi:hypothetical protein